MDKVESREDRLRAAIATDQSILGALCPEAQRRLLDFSFDREQTDGVVEAAEEILTNVQHELSSRRPRLEHAAAFELVSARQWAIYALSLITTTHAHAKKHELAVTEGSPLTACFGFSPFLPPIRGRALQEVQTHRYGVLRIPAYGCFAVIPESTRLGGRMWRQWCTDCAPNSRDAALRQARSHRRMVDSLS